MDDLVVAETAMVDVTHEEEVIHVGDGAGEEQVEEGAMQDDVILIENASVCAEVSAAEEEDEKKLISRRFLKQDDGFVAIEVSVPDEPAQRFVLKHLVLDIRRGETSMNDEGLGSMQFVDGWRRPKKTVNVDRSDNEGDNHESEVESVVPSLMETLCMPAELRVNPKFKKMSRSHCRIFWHFKKMQWAIRNSSKNGIVVNEAKLHQEEAAMLYPDMKICMCDSQVQIRWDVPDSPRVAEVINCEA